MNLKREIIIFTISFIPTFLMGVLPHLGVKTNILVSPVLNKTDNFEQVRSKLDTKSDLFKLNQRSSLIDQAVANSNYDSASAYGVIDFDSGEVIAEKNSEKSFPIASLTKIMSAVVALDLAKKDELFTVFPNDAVVEPTRIGVVPSQKMTLEELLDGALLTSANDAVEVIKDNIDQRYGQGVFVRAMNEKAKLLNLTYTSFDNPQGFDGPTQFSSVDDLAKLTHYALLNYPLIKQIVSLDYKFLPANLNHKQFDLYNWNGLLGVYPGVVGVKIGNTDDAKYTDVVLSERGNRKIMVILLGAPGVLERDLWSSELLDLGFQRYGIEGVFVAEKQLRNKYLTWKYWG